MVIWSFTPRRCTSILALASFGLSLCFVSGEAKAIVCDCNLPPEPEGAFVLADSVFHGILTGARDLPDENLFSFSLVTLWKGSVQGEVFSFTSCKCCTPCLKVGEEYLIFTLRYLFLGGPEPPPPGPTEWGAAPQPKFPCASQPPCANRG